MMQLKHLKYIRSQEVRYMLLTALVVVLLLPSKMLYQTLYSNLETFYVALGREVIRVL